MRGDRNITDGVGQGSGGVDRYRLVFENSLVGVFTVSSDRRIMEINRRACEIFGFPSDEDAVGRSISDVHVSRDHFMRFGEKVFSQIEAVGVSNIQYPLKRLDGEVFWAELSGNPINGRNRDDGVVWVIVDISAAKAAKEALHESEERYELAVAGANDGLWDWKIPSNEVYFSPRWKEILGFRDDELPNAFEEWRCRVHPDDLAAAWVGVQAHLKGETEHLAIEYRMRRKNGSWCWILARGKCVRDAGGRPLRMAGSHTDIDARKQVEGQLLDNQRRLEAVFGAVQTGIAVIDLTTRSVVDANEKAAEILGAELSDLIGRRCSDWFCYDPEACPFEDARTPSINQEIALRHRDGRTIPVLKSVVPLGLPDRSLLLESYVDISALKDAEVALRAAKEVAESAARAKSEFLAKMSHEIRTPMNSIIGMTKLTLDTRLDAEQRENLEIVSASSAALLGLIDDILDFSKIEAGRVELETIDFDLGHLIEEVLDSFAFRASEAGLELAYLIDPQVPGRLRGDPGRLRQILVNLIGNALKFTTRGEIVVDIGCVRRDGDAVEIRFGVADTGIGIPPETLGSIFDAFTQADNSIRRRYGGTGLGLSICRQLVHLMGGEIGVTSREGEGSEFWFRLPFPVAEPSVPDAPIGVIDLVGVRCLIVDDTRANRLLLEKTLRGWRCESVSVSGGREALAELRRAERTGTPYDLVLLDMAMPHMDGEETARAIRKDSVCGRPRVILLTSIGRHGDLARLASLGVSAYLTKPIKRAILYETMLATLGRAATKGPELQSVITDDSLRGFSLARLKVLLVEDKSFNQKVAERFLHKKQIAVTIVADGALALEAVRRERFDLVLMDVQMPVMDGYEATRAIRAEEARADEAGGTARRLPIIGMTAYALSGDRERCLDAGMDDYLTKPIDPDRLYAVIRKWSRERTYAPVLDQPSIPAAQPDRPAGVPVTLSDLGPASRLADIQLADPAALLERVHAIVGDDRDGLRELIVMFLDDVPSEVANLDGAIRRRDTAAILSGAHALKGMLRNFGLDAFAELFREIEDRCGRGEMMSLAAVLQDARVALDPLYAVLREQLAGDGT